MEKRIQFFHFQSVKAVAKAIDPHLRTLEALKKKTLALKEEYDEKQAKLLKEMDKKAAEIKQEYDACKTQIDALEAGVLQVTGFHVNDLVKKVIEPTGKTDPKTGKALKTTKYVPTDIVSYDETSKEFIISSPDEEPAGSDFDVDAEKMEPECPTPEEEDENKLPFE